MALYGGEYASYLAQFPMSPVPVDEHTHIRSGRSLDEVFEGAAFWRQLTDEEACGLRDGNGHQLLSIVDVPPVVLECYIDGKVKKFWGYIEMLAEDYAYPRGMLGVRQFYVLVEEPTPEECQQLAPFCDCMKCHPYFSRANMECVKDTNPSHYAIMAARKAQRAAQNRRCTIL
jgi:hypothetical protein